MQSMSRQPSLEGLLVELQGLKPELKACYQVSEVAVFGSYVRHGDSPASDLDVLVAFDEPPSLLRFIELENALSDRLGVKVDLVMRDALKPRIGERILREMVPV